MTIHLLSWNIWFGTYYEKVLKYLQHSHADIIGLQEVTQTPEGNDNIGEKLARKLGYSYVYATGMDLRPYGKPLVMGNAILSRFPIQTSRTHILSPKKESRSAIQADILIDHSVLHVVSTHLVHTHQQPSSIQKKQARDLITKLPKDCLIVMGDFNATPDTHCIQIMRKALRKVDGNSTKPTWSVYPEGCTVCSPKSLSIRLDYFFVTQDIRTKNFRIEQTDGSDHLPISMDVLLH